MRLRLVGNARFCAAQTAALTERADGLDQRLGLGQWALRLQLVQQHGETVMALLQQAAECRREAITAIHQAFIKGFQLMGEVADRANLGHPCTALEGVQIALQGRQGTRVFRLGQQALKGLTSTFEQVHGFLEEDLDHLGIQRKAAVCWRKSFRLGLKLGRSQPGRLGHWRYIFGRPRLLDVG